APPPSPPPSSFGLWPAGATGVAAVRPNRPESDSGRAKPHPAGTAAHPAGRYAARQGADTAGSELGAARRAVRAAGRTGKLGLRSGEWSELRSGRLAAAGANRPEPDAGRTKPHPARTAAHPGGRYSARQGADTAGSEFGAARLAVPAAGRTGNRLDRKS